MSKFTENEINDYKGKITNAQAKQLIKHCNNYNIPPEICAWYDDMEDFYLDWVYENEIFPNKSEAKERYKEGVESGEFKKFSNGEIVRLVI